MPQNLTPEPLPASCRTHSPVTTVSLEESDTNTVTLPWGLES